MYDWSTRAGQGRKAPARFSVCSVKYSADLTFIKVYILQAFDTENSLLTGSFIVAGH